jgi:hypothetical protein
MRGVQAGYVIFEEVAEEVKEEMKAYEPQVIGVDMKTPETPAAKKKARKSKKKAEEDKVVEDTPAGGEIESPKEEDGEF